MSYGVPAFISEAVRQNGVFVVTTHHGGVVDFCQIVQMCFSSSKWNRDRPRWERLQHLQTQ